MTRAAAATLPGGGTCSGSNPEGLHPRDRGIARVIATRLVQIPWVLLTVSVLVLVLVQVVPGDPGRNALGPQATSEQIAAWEAVHGLDGGVLERYFAWLTGFLAGDWGTSIVYGEPVFDLVLGRLLNSIALGMLSFAILVPVAIGLGMLQARAEGSRRDRVLTMALMSLSSVPEFVVGVLLLVTFAVVIPVLPVQSGSDAGSAFLPPLQAMMLPAITLALGSIAVIARTARAGIIDVKESQFYRTAVVKGLDRGTVIRRHVARNALIPTVSLLGIYLGAFLGGNAVVETLFGYPGLGELLVTATQRKDAAVLAAGTMTTATISLLALLIADVAFALLDPRVRFRERH